MFGIGIRGRGAGRKDNRLIRLVGDVKWETQPIDRREKSAAALSAAVDRRTRCRSFQFPNLLMHACGQECETSAPFVLVRLQTFVLGVQLAAHIHVFHGTNNTFPSL